MNDYDSFAAQEERDSRERYRRQHRGLEARPQVLCLNCGLPYPDSPTDSGFCCDPCGEQWEAQQRQIEEDYQIRRMLGREYRQYD